MIKYVDTHCHLNLFAQPASVLDHAPDTMVVAVTELPSQYRLAEARFRGDRRVRVSIGLHPLRAAAAGPLEEGQFVRWLPKTDYVGEIGLDFSRIGKDTKTAQLRVFDRLLAEAQLHQKVITVHSRGAEAVTIRKLSDAGLTAILHWFTGPINLVEDALAAGLYFSINPAMLRSQKANQMISILPRNRILTESDGPFAQSKDQSATPNDMQTIVIELARRWDDDPENVRHRLYLNFAALHSSTVGGVKV